MITVIEETATSARVTLIEQRLKALEERETRHETLTTLSPFALKIKKNIPVSIVTNGDDYIATFFDANISATGDTAGESVANLKDVLVLKFMRLNELPNDSLATVLKHQLTILREFIEA